MNLLYLSSPGGGLDTSVRVLGPALAKGGHHISVLYLHSPSGAISPSSPIDGCRIYQSKVSGWHYYVHRATFGLTNLPRVIRTLEFAQSLAKQITWIHQKEGLDLVEIPEIFATVKSMCRIPHIVRLHSADWTWRRMMKEKRRLADWIEPQMESKTLRYAKSISSPSKFLADYVRKIFRLDNRSIELIPYPVDTDQFRPGSEHSETPLVLFVGRVERRKGAHILMQAIPLILKEYPECKFVFVGRVCDDMKTEVTQAPRQVQFFSFCAHEKLVSWYQRASIFTAPSLWDNSPNVIYEAMACGVPVVATRAGGIPELVEDGVTGILVPSNDPNSLAHAMLSLLGDASLRNRMGCEGRKKAVAEYALEKITAKTLSFYKKTLAHS